jgi:hypothetical protein
MLAMNKNMKYKPILAATILLLINSFVFSQAVQIENGKSDSLIRKANALLENRIGKKLFNPKELSTYKSNLGEIIYENIENDNIDSTRFYSFYAVKKFNWNEWKLRIETKSYKKESKEENQNQLKHITKDVWGNNNCSGPEDPELTKALDEDTLLLYEIDAWENPKKK